METAQQAGNVFSSRYGKTVYTGSIWRDMGLEAPIRIVFQVMERTVFKNGQLPATPEIDVQTWRTSLKNPEGEIIRLCHERAVCEQFHSEIKSDIVLVCFPSGSFDTNAAMLKLAAFAYNILRVIGQSALGGNAKLTGYGVFRLWAKTVMNRLIFMAGHIISRSRQSFLSLGRGNVWCEAFIRVYTEFA